jgi:xanthine dehydrogenase YagR molybdenum-binding subunit
MGLRPGEVVAHRRHRLPAGRFVRQHHHGVDHAAGAQRRHRALRELLEAAAPALGAPPESLIAKGGRIATADNARSMSFREAAATLRTDRISVVASRADDYGGFARKMGDSASARNALGGVQFAQVAVDVETGIVRVERVVAVQDCGRPMNPRQIESQVQGGVLHGNLLRAVRRRLIDRHTGPWSTPTSSTTRSAGRAKCRRSS